MFYLDKSLLSGLDLYMKNGSIKFAQHEGIYIIKMEGDVRLTLCLSFDSFINDMLEESDFCSVIFDLSEAKAIDSTTLGLMAKISIRSQPMTNEYPVVITNNKSITRILESMGFTDIFRMVKRADFVAREFSELEPKLAPEELVKQKVIEAHKTLMALNETNADTFRELIESLDCL